MGVNQGHVLGRAQRFYCEPENFDTSTDTVEDTTGGGTAATMVKATAAGAAKVLSTDFDFDQEREKRRDIQDGADPYIQGGENQLITKMRNQALSVEAYLIGSGSGAGFVPDLDTMLIQAWGKRVRVAATSVTYSPTNGQICLVSSAHRLFSLQNASNPFIAMESGIGWLINEYKITVSGGDHPKHSFAGECFRHIGTATSLVASTVDGSNFTVTAGEGDGFGANTVAGSLGLGGSVIQVGADDNSGAGYELTAVSGDTLTSTGAGWTPLVSEVVAPFAPAPSTSGSVVSHTLGSMTVGGTAFRITGAEFTLNRNLNYFKDEAFADGLSDANPGWREMSISMTLRARKDRIGELERRKRFTARAVTMVMGATAGNTWTLAMPTVEFMVGKMDVPDSPGGGEGTITIVGTPLDSAEGAADRATLAIT